MKNESGLLSGRVNFSVKTERGNGNEGYIDFDADVTYRRKIDRFFMTGELENDSKVDEITGEKRTTKDKWLLNGSYNYFLNKKTYLGASMSFEHNPLADLNLRTTAGPLVGYQFFESKSLNLKAEVGMMLKKTIGIARTPVIYILPGKSILTSSLLRSGYNFIMNNMAL